MVWTYAAEDVTRLGPGNAVQIDRTIAMVFKAPQCLQVNS
jgi:hypothetical protein